MAEGTFTAQVRAAVAKRKDLMREVYVEAVEDHIDIMQITKGAGGNMPVRDGFLRASLKAGIGHVSFPVTYKPKGDVKFEYDAAAVTLVISGAQVSDPITVSYTANYARHREYGARGMPGDRFAGLAAQRWPQTVAAAEKRVKARHGL